MKIEEYETHQMYPTRFFRYAVYRLSPDKVLQELWRNLSNDKEWRDVPTVLIEPEIKIEEILIDTTSI